jgi:sulfite reductase beta subunit-like hemoprotein
MLNRKESKCGMIRSGRSRAAAPSVGHQRRGKRTLRKHIKKLQKYINQEKSDNEHFLKWVTRMGGRIVILDGLLGRRGATGDI